MKLHNTLTRQTEQLIPIKKDEVSIYSCGPTVYDRVHIGNLASFIYADTLRRTLMNSGLKTNHVMNYTDIDDKTIKRSRRLYSNKAPMEALISLTTDEINIFNKDAEEVGIDTQEIEFIKATDNIKSMQSLIKQLITNGFAYLADDGIYFSIEKYKQSNKKYGQLSKITTSSTENARINNDEYDKTSAHDFALWKFNKDGEPSWEFIIDDINHPGRPGWHIECSAMSNKALGTPFDIHTGGIDLIFPHHENEIAQSTAGQSYGKLANIFVHNEHLLIDDKKMSKSLNNFYTLKDLKEHGFLPMSLRVLVLQAHYRSILHFSWANLKSAENRLKSYQAMADLCWQAKDIESDITPKYIEESLKRISSVLEEDLNTPEALKILSEFENKVSEQLLPNSSLDSFNNFVQAIDQLFGFNLHKSDISEKLKNLIKQRETARQNDNYEQSDQLRDELSQQGIAVRDTQYGTIWHRV